MIICRDCKAEFRTANKLLDHYIKTHDTHKVYFSDLGKKSQAVQLKKYGKAGISELRRKAVNARWAKKGKK